MLKTTRPTTIVCLWLAAVLHPRDGSDPPRQDLVAINGGSHKLIGYGLVVGLQGTGDGKNAVFTIRSLANMLQQFGVSVEPSELEVANVAATIVTAELPAYAVDGTKLDVTVSSMGDSRSLQGGTLLVTPLRGADGEVYAIAQGPISIGGFSAGGDNASVSRTTRRSDESPTAEPLCVPRRRRVSGVGGQSASRFNSISLIHRPARPRA